MKKKKLSPLLWLLLLPCQLIASGLFIWLGSRLDLYLLTNSNAHGHGAPFFSVLFLLAASVMTLIVFILALFLTIRSFRQRRK